MRLLLALSIPSLAVAGAGAVKNRYGSLPMVPQGLTPRYFVDKSHPVAKRDGSCGEGNHSCLEIGRGDRCCDNDSYCYINKAGSPKCCAIGSNCTNDSPCGSTAFYCTRGAGSGSTQTGCCDRACPQTSHYLCPSSLGGNCCPYGADCQAGGNCIATMTVVVAIAVAIADVRPDPRGRRLHHVARCTQVAGTGFCADGGPTGTPVPIGDGPSGLSVAATAGIAIGAVVAGGLIIGTAAWLFISKRRGSSSHSLRTASRQLGGNDSPPGVERAMTTVTASSQAWPGRGDFWSESPSGPFTETAPALSPAPGRAVPNQPERPGDIAAPVEIGPGEREEGPAGEPRTPNSAVTTTFADLPRTETTDGRFELHGSDVAWTQFSPLSPTAPKTDQGA